MAQSPPSTTPALPSSPPSAQGVDAAGISALLDALDAAPGVELHSLMVVRHGHVVAQGWWAPYSPDRVHLLYSLSKSFASAAAGFAEAEGLLDHDATVLSYFPELDADITDPRSRAIRVRDVAAMASGHLGETIEEAFADRDGVRGFLRIPPERDPGTVFAYNQPCTYTLAVIVQRAAGCSLTEYLTPRLLGPLGVTHAAWQQRAGQDLGYSGFHLTTAAIARFGQTLLDDGVWAGKRLLPAGWVARATREHVPTVDSAGESSVATEGGDWARGYGWQFWQCRHGYRGDGAYGQFCVVVPEHDLVVATTGACEDMQAVLDAIWDHLLPALSPEPLEGSAERSGIERSGIERSEVEAALAGRLAAAALQVVPAGTLAGTDAVLTLADASGLRGITGLTLRGNGAGWALDVQAWDGALTAEVGIGRWAVTAPDDGTAPVAVCAGRTDDGTVVVDLVLLETPHRLRLEGSLHTRDATTGTLTANWHTEPLGGVSLRSMQRPLGAGVAG